MNYILYGEQYPMIRKRLNKILAERLGEPDDFNVARFDASEDDIDEIIADMSLLPLGYERKAVVIDNADFLTSSGDKKVLEKFTDNVVNDDSIDILFIVRSSDLNPKLELVERIKNEGQIFELKEISKDDWPKFCVKYFEDRGAKIDPNAVDELLSRIGNDLNHFMNEANKLILYKNHITLVDITLMVAKPIEEDVFQISNALFRGDNDTALEIYRGLKLLGSKSTDTLIPLLAGQIRFINEVRFLSDKGLAISDIASELNAKEGRVRFALKNSKYLSRRQIAHVLDDLYRLDYQTKSGLIDRFYGFELFLINFPN